MATIDQEFTIGFTSGIDTGSNEQNVVSGKLAVLENGYFSKTGKISKRHGYDRLAPTIEPSGTIASGKQIFTYNDELLLSDGYNLYSRSTALDKYIARRTDIHSASASVRPMVNNADQQINADTATSGNGLSICVWEDSRGGVRYSLMDTETNTLIVNDVEVDSDGYSPRALWMTDRFILMFHDGTSNIACKTVLVSSPTVLTNNGPILQVNKRFDAVVVNGYLFVAYTSLSSTVILAKLDIDFTVVGSATVHNAAATYGVCCWSDSSNRIWVAGAEGGTLRYAIRDFAMTAVRTSTIIEIVTDANVCALSGVAVSSTQSRFFWEVNNVSVSLTETDDPMLHRIRTVVLDVSASVGTIDTILRGHGLSSEAFISGNDVLVAVSKQSELQSSYYLTKYVAASAYDSQNLSPISVIHHEIGGGHRTNYTLPNVHNTTAGVFVFPVCRKKHLESAEGQLFSRLGVDLCSIDLNNNSATIGTQIVDNLYISGGILTTYDGNRTAEAGFLAYPEELTADSTNVSFTIVQNGSGGAPEITDGYMIAGNRIASGQCWLLASANNATSYYVWYRVDGIGEDPALTDVALTAGTGIMVDILFTYSATQVAAATASAIDALADFSATNTAERVRITNAANGATQNASNYTMGYGSISAGSYEYVAVYEYTDNNNVSYTSATSLPLAVTTLSNNLNLTITVPTLKLTKRRFSGGGATIGIFRSTRNASDGIYYRVTSIAAPLNNDTSVDTVSFLDAASDDDIISNETLYTSGGAKDSVLPPSSSCMTTYRGRLWLNNTQQTNQVHFSKVVVPGEAAQFTAESYITVDPTGGPVLALGWMDQILVIFKEAAIYRVYGEGPDSTGANSDYSTPELLPSDVGCSNPRSVVLTPAGLMFQSSKGIYLLDRTFNLVFIGREVLDYNSLTITAAVLSTPYNQVRFSTAEGTCLVYDYDKLQWFVFTNHSAVSALNWNNNYCWLRADGSVMVENTSSYSDDGTAIVMRLVTSWLNLSGIQSFHRVKNVMLLGTYISPHTLTIRTYHDFSDSVVSQLSTAVSASPYQFNVKLKSQKSTALKIEIYDTTSNPGTEAMSLTAIKLLVGKKSSTNKLADSRKLGTS